MNNNSSPAAGSLTALIVIPCEGFSYQEYLMVRRVLEEDNIRIGTTATTATCESTEHQQLIPDQSMNKITVADWDAVVLLDTTNGSVYRDSAEILALVRDAWTMDKVIAAAGSAILAVANTGFIDGYRICASTELVPEMESKGATITGAMAQRDGLLITSCGREATEVFAHLVSGAIQGKEE